MEVIVQDANNIVIEVDQGRQGRGVEDVSLITVGADYYLLFTFTDGTTEQVGPIATVTEVILAEVRNAEAVTILKGQPVYLYQAQGNLATVKLAYNTSDATSAKTLGLAAENIAPNAQGLITCQGTLGGLNTSAYSEGDTLYLGATAGTLTNVKPQAPNHLVYIGVVERANAGAGQIYVRVQNGFELDEIHDVRIISPVNGNTLIYDAATDLWKNAGITAGTGVSVTNGPASITVGNTGVLSLSGGTTGLTPATATTGAVTLAGTLGIANGGTGQTTANAALNALLPSQATQSGKYLKTDGTNASWDQLDISTADITGVLPTANGGTGQSSYATGDLLYATGATTLSKLTVGTNGQILTSSGTAPQWTNASSITIGTATNLAGGAAGSVPYQTGAGATTFLSLGTAGQVLQVNAGATAPEWVSSSGTGNVARVTSPSFTTPSLGAATATSINNVAFTAPATGSTLTIADGKTLTANASLTLAGTDGTTMTFPGTSASIARTDAAQTFTGTQTFAPAANTSAIVSSAYSLTGSNAQSMFDLSGTWNTSGTPTALKLNITDTASNAASLLMDLRVGGASRFNIGTSGQSKTVVPLAYTGKIFEWLRSTTSVFSMTESGVLTTYSDITSTVKGWTIGSNLAMPSDMSLVWNSDTVLRRDAANTLAQRNGVNPQTFRLYNTFTTVSDYERATIAWDTNVCYFAYENGGTGNANRQLRFGARGTTNWFEYSANNGLNVTWSSSTNFSRTRWLNGNIQFDVGTVTSLFGLNTSGTSRLTLADAVDIEVNTTTGTKIGTATTQKIGFWNAAPIAQPTTAVAAATVAATGSGDVVAASTTFDGYTIPQIVKALRNAGLLA